MAYEQLAEAEAAETLSVSLSCYGSNTDLSQDQTQECDLDNIEAFNSAVQDVFDSEALYDGDAWIQ